MLKKKLDSVIGEKGIAIRLIEGSAKGNINSEQEMAQKEKQIESLECKLYSLELLLRYMQGNERHENSDMHAIINRLTETITEKELQLHEFKKINKELLQQRLKGGSGDNKDGSD